MKNRTKYTLYLSLFIFYFSLLLNSSILMANQPTIAKKNYEDDKVNQGLQIYLDNYIRSKERYTSLKPIINPIL